MHQHNTTLNHKHMSGTRRINSNPLVLTNSNSQKAVCQMTLVYRTQQNSCRYLWDATAVIRTLSLKCKWGIVRTILEHSSSDSYPQPTSTCETETSSRALHFPHKLLTASYSNSLTFNLLLKHQRWIRKNLKTAISQHTGRLTCRSTL